MNGSYKDDFDSSCKGEVETEELVQIHDLDVEEKGILGFGELDVILCVFEWLVLCRLDCVGDQPLPLEVTQDI